MEDQGIVELFFDRSEQAIVETDKKYGGYCYTIAYNILASREDSEESVSDTYFSAWNTIPPRKPTLLQAFLGKIARHISIDRWRKQSAQKRGGKEMILALEELGECVDIIRGMETEITSRELTHVSTASWPACRKRSGMYFCAGTGIWTPSRPLRASPDSARVR